MILAEHVARGVALLDEKMPGWIDRIDLDALQMSSCHTCVLGQLFADVFASTDGALSPFGEGVWALGIQDAPAAHGFDGYDADALDAEWRRVITERRAAA